MNKLALGISVLALVVALAGNFSSGVFGGSSILETNPKVFANTVGVSGALTVSGATLFSSTLGSSGVNSFTGTATNTFAGPVVFSTAGKGPIVKTGASCFQFGVATSTFLVTTSSVACQ
jgi:hypothetical protein